MALGCEGLVLSPVSHGLGAWPFCRAAPVPEGSRCLPDGDTPAGSGCDPRDVGVTWSSSALCSPPLSPRYLGVRSNNCLSRAESAASSNDLSFLGTDELAEQSRATDNSVSLPSLCPVPTEETGNPLPEAEANNFL